jgi:ketosteroid isomerase-like protein
MTTVVPWTTPAAAAGSTPTPRARKIDERLGEEGSFTRTLHDILASDDHAIQLVSVEAKRSDGRTAHWNAALVMHVRDGKISEVWANIDDPYAVEDLLEQPRLPLLRADDGSKSRGSRLSLDGSGKLHKRPVQPG